MFKKSIFILLSASSLYSNPEGPRVIEGEAHFSETGSTLEIRTSDRSVVEWKAFSIQPQETTRFIQPSTDSAVMNRVTGTEISQLMGSLQANGRVYLINPNGVIVGKEGRIDTAAFLATTLQIDADDFMKGQEAWLQGDSLASIIHLGVIETKGGPVSLLAHRVENPGEIQALKSHVSLIAGHEILLSLPDQKAIYIRPDLPSEGVSVEGSIKALETQIETTGAPSLAISLGGHIEANRIVEKEGRIFLCAQEGDIKIDPSGSIVASQGAIALHAKKGLSEIKGTLQAKGGEVKVLGKVVALADQGSIDVSSEKNGGTVLFGGDYLGKNPDVPNAKNVFLGPHAKIHANSTSQGDGGKVIVWGDESNLFFGQIEAKGGPKSGDGGFIEISSKGALVVEGNVSTKAAHGQKGTLLLDPTNVCITDNGGTNINATYGGGTYTYTGNAATPCGFNGVVIDSGNLGTILAGSNVLIDTAASADQGETGNISMISPVVINTGNSSFTLTANGNIDLSADLNNTPMGFSDLVLILNATNQINFNSMTTIVSTIQCNAGGDINITGSSINGRNPTISPGTALNFNGSADLNITNSALFDANNIDLSTGGMINLSGSVSIDINNFSSPCGFPRSAQINSNVGITGTTTIDIKDCVSLSINNPISSVGGAQNLTFTASAGDAGLVNGELYIYSNIGSSSNPFGAISFSQPNAVTFGGGSTPVSLYGSSLNIGSFFLNADGTDLPQGMNYFNITGPLTFTGTISSQSSSLTGALTINTTPATSSPIDFTGVAIGDVFSSYIVLVVNNTDTTVGTIFNGTTLTSQLYSSFDGILTLTGTDSTFTVFGSLSFGGPILAGANLNIDISTGDIPFGGPITISTNSTFSVPYSNLIFNAPFYSSGGTQNFSLNIGGNNATFNADIGTSANPFGALDLTSNQTTLGGNIYSSTSLNIAAPIILTNNTSMNVTGPITLGASITGSGGLSVSTTSSFSLPSTVGGVGSPIGALSIASTGSGTGTSLNGAAIYAGSVNFSSTDPTLGGNGYAQLNGGPITIDTSPNNGSVTFGGAILGGQNLTITSGTGAVQFAGPVSGGNSAFSVTGGSISVAQNFTTTAQAITFTSTGTISVGNSAAVTISAGSNTPLTWIASSNISLGSGNTIQTDGDIFMQGENISATGAGTIQTTGATNTLIFVADAQNPSSIGDGSINFPSSMTLCTAGCTGTGGNLLLYTSHPSVLSYSNSFPSTINGTAYRSGTLTSMAYTTGTNEFVGYYYPALPSGFSAAFGIFYKGIIYPPSSLPTTIQAALLPPNPTPDQTAASSLTQTVQGVTTPNPKKACGIPSVAIGTP